MTRPPSEDLTANCDENRLGVEAPGLWGDGSTDEARETSSRASRFRPAAGGVAGFGCRRRAERRHRLAGTGQELFGSGGGQRLADEIGAPLLARIPLDPVLRECADDGTPVLEAAPESEGAEAILALAEAVAATRVGTMRKALTVLG